ncbi:BTAD domain-containing putative transcriptional regulator [Vulgatibacter incomptus]|uniref:Transcriptional regulator, SARP family n=1 Tax=Vulgatibacter incomptus TaxID=1391653 RepID=A0A0K1PGE5_9BACT|nr:BTAD domain-containing putative transcriptional regulator [Vulgatibacter incomptus]AKU92590.1 transcriptional regulator, SARP family [Vulgatibacter incomptus]
MDWRLQLLRQARLYGPDGASVELDRKTAALLAYLSLEGPSSRSRIAGLLWPDSGDARARANLRQALSRLRRLAGGPLVESGDPLRLAARAEVDVLRLQTSAFAGAPVETPFRDRILPDCEFPDCPELSDWLAASSDDLRRLVLSAWEAEADRLERLGEARAALDRAQRALALDSFSERAHRRVIRLHYLLGDRSAALGSYERCRQVLAEELGVEPLPETRELARLVERGALPTAAGREGPEIPVSVLRPPRIVGRERELARMEAAWNAGRIVFLAGPAGIGKSRLALDFAASKGAVLVVESRPGDVRVPYASQSRGVRQVLSSYPDVVLPDWVRRELSRMIPELARGEAPIPRLGDRGGRLRFYQAQVELLRLLRGSRPVLFVDDLQFCDPDSGEIGHFMFSNHPVDGEEGAIRPIITFRPAELAAPLAESVRQLVAADLAEVVELQPLDQDAVTELLRELELSDLAEHGAALSGAAGGNPALLLELVRNSILEGWPARPVPLPRELLRSRFARLSASALRLAQVAAVAGELLSPDLAASVLGRDPLDLAEAWRELEEAQILRGNRFSLDMLQEALLSDLPRPLVAHVHRRIASFLEQSGADPTSIALHWQGAGDTDRAAPYLLVKAEPVTPG